MATTTTNYGFDVPTSSDLVKNGATAISTLGQDLDTFLFRPFTRNAVLNSSFNIWQRGTSFAYAGGNQYTADRWCFGSGALGRTVSRQVTGDTTNLPNIQYCARVQRDSGNTSTASIKLNQSLETVNSIPFAGKQVTLSFYARKGANFSSASDVLTVALYSGTGTDQNVDVTYTGSATPATASATLTTTWQRFTATGTVASTATEVAILASYTPVGTAGAADYFEITGVMLEVGNQASPYISNAGTIQGELAACQRYYYRSIGNEANAALTPWGVNVFTTVGYIAYPLPVQMRVKPSSVDFSTIELSDYTAEYALSAVAISSLSTPNVALVLGTSAGLTQYRPILIRNDNNAAGYIGFSAEL